MARLAVTDVSNRPKPVVLLILDGWGLSPSWSKNVVTAADPPSFQYLWRHFPHTTLQSFKLVAGPSGEVGSTEIGHVSIGTGRIIKEDLAELDLMVQNGQFFSNPTLVDSFRSAARQEKAVHLVGLLSAGGIHSSSDHAAALIRMAKAQNVKKLWLHIITDGIDVAPQSSLAELKKIDLVLAEAGIGQIATVVGRDYAMDRDGNWSKTEVAYRVMLTGEGKHLPSARAAIQDAYSQGLADQNIPPTTIVPEGAAKGEFIPGRFQPGDLIIAWNFRADRMWQLVRAIADPKALRRFGLVRRLPLVKPEKLITLTDYHLSLPNVEPAFPAAEISNCLGELLTNHNFSQLHLAETEKQSHVTYFFNGGRIEPFDNEDDLILPSPKVKTYAEQPAMAAGPITRALERAIKKKSHDFIVANYANVDMVAKTHNAEASKVAVLVVDEAIRRVANAVIEHGGVLFITADHGPPPTHAQGTSESLALLPLIQIEARLKKKEPEVTGDLRTSFGRALRSKHTLADVAPTILERMGIPKPSDMTGSSLLDELE